MSASNVSGDTIANAVLDAAAVSRSAACETQEQRARGTVKSGAPHCFRIYEVPREMVTDFWSAVEPMLAKALEHHPHLDAPGVLRLLVANFAQMLVMTKGGKIVAACVMERTQYPSHTVANVVALTADYGIFRSHGLEIKERLETWGKERGCDRIAFVGRPGWTRFFVNRIGARSIPLVHAWKSL